jgi:hypothetical protein
MKARTKNASILATLFAGNSLHRFQAERIGDHCLHSTISTLTHDYGLAFERRPVRVPNRFGSMTKVKEYRLAQSSRDPAEQLLKKWGELQ